MRRPREGLVTTLPGGSGSPSAGTNETGCPSGAGRDRASGRNPRARDSEKVRPSRGSHGPGAKNRRSGAPKGEPPDRKGGAAEAERRRRNWKAPFGALSSEPLSN